MRIAAPGLRLGLLAVVLTMAALGIVWVVSGARIPIVGGGTDTGAGVATRAGTLEHHLYFADGETGPDVWTSYAIYNPGSEVAHVLVVLRVGAVGLEYRRALTIAAGEQTRYVANDLVSQGTFSAHLSSDQKVYAEKTTLWLRGDGVSAQAMQPASTWFFGEAEVGNGYRSLLAVFSPGAAASITVTCLFSATQPLTVTYPVSADARTAIDLGEMAVSGRLGLVLVASRPVVAELTTVSADARTAYGGPGATTLSKTWYAFATTREQYRTRLTFINPNDKPTVVRATVIPRATAPTRNLELKAWSRAEMDLAEYMVDKAAVVILEANRPVAVQEITTFGVGPGPGESAAYSTMAVPAPATREEEDAARTTYLADTEGSEFYDTYLLLYNPGSSAARVEVAYMVGAGGPVVRGLTLGARQRSVHLVRAEAMGMRTSAAVVRSNQALVVERVTVPRTREGASAVATTGARPEQDSKKTADHAGR